jgi:hypothetical protein
MKTRLIVVLPVLAFAASAMAATSPVILMQFGSFETEKEAQAHLQTITNKHAGIVGRLPSSVREVQMAPGLSVFRTQAGPVGSRTEAQSICAQLASNGDECYIVETAMAQAPAPVAASAPILTPPPSASIKPLSTPSVTALPSVPKLEAPAMAKPALTAPKAATPVAAEAPATTRIANAEVRKPITDAAKAIREGQPVQPTARDPENVRTLEKVEAARDINEALDAAKAEQARNEIAPGVREVSRPTLDLPDADLPIATKQEAPEPSFWSRLNPFSDDTADAKSTANVTKQPAPTVPAQDTADMPATSQRISPQAPVVETPVAAAPRDSEFAPAALAAQRTLENPAAPVGEQAPVIAPKGALLPPPLPTNEMAKRGMVTSIANQPLDTSAPEALRAPYQAARISPGQTISEAARSTSSVTAVVPGSGAVEVEEAQRVPVTQNLPAPPPPTSPSVASSAAPIVQATQMPSESGAQKTLWAQLGTFPNAQAALAFWDTFRNANPDFPVVRVRVTASYMAIQKGDERVALRVGPFMKHAFINALCTSEQVNDADLECMRMTDMGVSANPYLGRDAQTKSYQAGRYGRAGTGVTAPRGFWVQLGSYQTTEDANRAWNTIKNRNPSVLGTVAANISSPSLGSHATPVYRLRAGSFTTERTASNVCARLKDANQACLVVSE